MVPVQLCLNKSHHRRDKWKHMERKLGCYKCIISVKENMQRYVRLWVIIPLRYFFSIGVIGRPRLKARPREKEVIHLKEFISQKLDSGPWHPSHF